MTARATLAVAGGVLAGAAGLAPAVADAQPFSYDYVEGALVATEAFDGDEDLIGPRIAGSVTLNPWVFARAEASYLTDDTDVTTLTAGPGLRLSVHPDVDLYGVASVAYQDFDPDGASSTDDAGYQLAAGIRHGCLLVEDLAYTWEARYRDIDDFDDVTDLRAQGVYDLAGGWQAVGELQINDAGDDNNLGLALGGRFNF